MPEVEIPPLIQLPPRPVVPEPPRPYDGATIDLLKPVVGYGLPSAGKISLRSHHGVKKFFGVGGQGQRTQENLSYTLNDINTMGSCDLDDEIKRFFILSVYPRIELDDAGDIIPFDQRAERLKFTVQSEFINKEFDFTVPESTESVIRPLSPPSDARV